MPSVLVLQDNAAHAVRGNAGCDLQVRGAKVIDAVPRALRSGPHRLVDEEHAHRRSRESEVGERSAILGRRARFAGDAQPQAKGARPRAEPEQLDLGAADVLRDQMPQLRPLRERDPGACVRAVERALLLRRRGRARLAGDPRGETVEAACDRRAERRREADHGSSCQERGPRCDPAPRELLLQPRARDHRIPVRKRVVVGEPRQFRAQHVLDVDHGHTS